MVRRYLVPALCFVFILSGCNLVKRVMKDIPVQQQDQLDDQYIGKEAWTRSLLIDLGPEGVIDRDVKVKIISLDLHWTGSVMVEAPNRHRITHGLGLERPLTMQAVQEKMDRLFWFGTPEYRYRMNLRKFGKKTSKAVFDHQVFKGMKREAALESWGFPDEMKSTDIGGKLEEQWIYKDVRQKTKKRYVFIVEGQVDNWEE
jgi:hypothetical protein